MSYRVVVQPTEEPVTLEQARLHLRLAVLTPSDPHPDDPIIQTLITAARESAENFCARTLPTQTIEYVIDGFPATASITLPRSPAQSVVSVQYVDRDGATQTLAPSAYTLDNYGEYETHKLICKSSWPETSQEPNSVKIRYVAGYATTPAAIRAAISLTVGHLYENRENSVIGAPVAKLPYGAEYLLMPYRLGMGV